MSLPDDVRAQAFTYVDTVLARAKGTGRAARANEVERVHGRSAMSRLVPGSVKRALVRFLIYVMRHPFDHLAHPLQTQLEEEIGQARGVAHAALTRAEHTQAEVRRLRGEINRQRPSS